MKPPAPQLDHAALADRWLHCMRRGDFPAAWEISDVVLAARAGVPCHHLPRHEQYIWDGTPLDGCRVLIRCYHGLGDTLQFIRFAPLVKARAREVLVWAQPRLIPLLETVAGIDRLLPLHDGDPGVTYDVDVELMELPHVFRTTLQTLPCSIPYVHVEPARLPADRTRVGIVWKAGDWAPHRSVPFHLVAPLFDLPFAWYILQSREGLAKCPPGIGTIAGTDDIVELARVTGSLDLVITIDSMTAHLAGALGVPVWTLLPHTCDWRWMEGRDDSPWYPTMKLFRQRREGEWAPVLQHVRTELERWPARA